MKSALKSIGLVDALILAVAIWIVVGIDFDHMSVMDKVYVVTFAIWIVLFLLRLCILYKRNGQGEDEKG